MKLRKRQESKRTQALDALASVAKTWSEWQLAKRASKGIAKGAKKATKLKLVTSDSKLKRALAFKPVRIAGLVAIVGGVGAAVAAKLKGRKAEPIYTPPPPTPPSQPESPAALEDVPPPPPTPVEPDDVATIDPAEGSGPDEAAQDAMQAGRATAAQEAGQDTAQETAREAAQEATDTAQPADDDEAKQ